MRLLGGMPEHDHDRFPGRGIHETECAGKAGLVVQRGDQLVGDDPMHLWALLVSGPASNELCIHGLLLSQVSDRVLDPRPLAPWQPPLSFVGPSRQRRWRAKRGGGPRCE